MNQNVLLVDNAVRQYLARSTSTEFTSRQLAAIAAVPRWRMSLALQDYRLAQARGQTRYVLGAEGYGRASSWHVLAKPGSDPAHMQLARRGHAKWVARDALRRYIHDRIREVQPGLHAVDQQLIDSALNMVEAQLEAAVVFVESQL
jgi:hypothetical protein